MGRVTRSTARTWGFLGIRCGETAAADSRRGQYGDLHFQTVSLADGRWLEGTWGAAHTAGVLMGEPAPSLHRVLCKGPFPWRAPGAPIWGT